MSEHDPREEAAHALAEIERRRNQVIEVALLPVWFWWVLALLNVGLAVAVDTYRGRPAALGLAVGAFVVAVLGVSGGVVIGARRRAAWRDDLLGERGPAAIVAFVGLTVGGDLAIAFALDAAGVGHAATWAGLVGAVIMVAGGAVLTRLLRRIMQRTAGHAR
ncbi:MAG: hypothetical protein H0X35_12175 [Pseudonocardiales bacterium]|nr:hypothetical protein [Pseudonocardiales bacterium]